MNRVAVMNNGVAGLQMNWHLARQVIGTVVSYALREAENAGSSVRANTAKMRTRDVTQTAILLINWIERQPDGKDVRRFQTEIVIVLVRRRGAFRTGRFV